MCPISLGGVTRLVTHRQFSQYFFWVAKRPSSGFDSERIAVTATIDRMGDYVGGKPQFVVLLLQTEC